MFSSLLQKRTSDLAIGSILLRTGVIFGEGLRGEETNMRKLNAVLIIAMAFVLAVPGIALAGKKKVEGLTECKSSLNYSKPTLKYTQQGATNPKPPGVKSGSRR